MAEEKTYTRISEDGEDGEAQDEAGENTQDFYSTERDLAVATLHMKIHYTPLITGNIETDSVYGMVFIIPQIARSAKWSLEVQVLTIRSVVLYLLNCVLQGLLLYMINKEENVMDKFSGQMRLCDFGAFQRDCPDGVDCKGPYGTAITPERLYSWNQIVTRSFVRDSLLSLFPDRSEEIMSKVDPGEYGLEDYWCRAACVFVFTLSIMEELLKCLRMVRLLCEVPTRDDSWIQYDGDDGDHDISVKVAGMPWYWKLINVICVVMPKAVLWKWTAEAGTLFLMESAGIDDVIVNAVALSFILGIDELIYSELTQRSTKDLLDSVNQYEVIKLSKLSKERLIDEHHVHNLSISRILRAFNGRLAVAMCVCCFQMWSYYSRYCDTTPSGHFISKAQFLPQEGDYSIWMAMLPRFFETARTEDQPYWEMAE